MSTQRSLFDVLGPVMIGPSSSHTAGAARLGLLARAIFGRTPKQAHIELHGSFASTGHGHGTDLALVGGLLGIAPDDPAIVSALDQARGAGLEVTFAEADLGEVHPNSVRFELSDGDESLIIQGASIGGADVLVTRIGEFEVQADGRLPLLIVAHVDWPGEIAAVSGLLAREGANIAGMRVSRTRRGSSALMLIETDTAVSDAVVEAIAGLALVTAVRRVQPI